MGEDGARRVVVNSVGREIRTLEEEEPTEGKRASADGRLRRRRKPSKMDSKRRVQSALPSILDPSNGEVLGFTSRPGLRPQCVCRPASTGQHGPR